jgi:O-antigen/teichoic acid export membrane protein
MKFFINVISNIINGSANAIFALVLPPLLISKMSLEEYALWSYCLQTGALIGYLNLGVQTAVGRYVALYKENLDNVNLINVINVADKILYFMFLLGLFISCLLYFNINSLIEINQVDLLLIAPKIILIVSVGYCFSLLLNSYLGYFIGIRSNHVPMWINLISKIILGILVVFYVERGLLFISYLFLSVNIITYLTSIILWKQTEVNKSSNKSDVYKDKMSFIKFCLALAVWNLGMLLVTGLNSTIVGYFSFIDVAYFTIANGLILAMIGFFSTGMNPLIQVFTSFFSKGENENISFLIVFLNKLLSFIILFFYVIYNSIDDVFFNAWLSEGFSNPVKNYASLLVIGMCIRILNIPYALALISTGNQRKALAGALLEGVSNIFLGVVFCYFINVHYIALSMIISTVIATSYNLLINVKRTSNDIPLKKKDFLCIESLLLLLSLITFEYFYISLIFLVFSFCAFIITFKQYGRKARDLIT